MAEGSQRDDVLRALERRERETEEALCDLARIPSVSAPGFDAAEVDRSARRAAELARAAGLESAEVVRQGGAHPYVISEGHPAPRDAPAVLIYAHHDVQPPGRAERWKTPAFEPTVRDDGRLYGRGVVDDKAGLLVHLAAVRAWLDARGSLPVRVTLLVEGEEEIGSPHLEAFLAAHRDRLRADVIVLSDTANLAQGLPSITTSLRGLVVANLRVRALRHPVHSGMWGGPLLDAASALARILARLTDDEGRLAVPGIEQGAPVLSPQERERLLALPFDEAGFRAESGALAELRLGGEPGLPVYQRLWFRPAVAVQALESVPLSRASNQLCDEARAQVGVRVAPGQDPHHVRDAVLRCLTAEPPYGVRVETEVLACVPGWRTEPRGPAFDAARRALRLGFGRDAVEIGCGGTIPFVGPFASAMGEAPALLLGLEDPVCNAHGENESLHLGDFRAACRSSVHLLEELRTALQPSA
jgi:acetylornithine deacetylase/succinyl-diaminopimelate desuccinylase-like protein